MCIEYLIEKYSRLVYKICYDMLNNPQDAEDMTQEVYISLYNSFDRYKELEENDLKNITCKIALNKCKDYFKSKQKKTSDLSDNNILSLENYVQDGDIDDEIIKKERKKQILEILKRINEPYSSVLYDYYIVGLSLDEIAKKNKVVKSTLKMQLYRAKKKFREEIEVNGGEGLI